jgi:TorA maturation chaperone TorD
MSTESKAIDSMELSAEDQARAGCYALIGRLFYDAPDRSLLEGIARERGAFDTGRGNAPGALAQALQSLQAACAGADPATVSQEHDMLFVGVGRAEVTPYTSYYVTSTVADRHLVALREQLAEWGLTRRNMTFELEDHIAGVCDVMRFLIEQGVALEEQELFFERFMYPEALAFCDAVTRAPSAGFYKELANFTRIFLEVEKTAFEMIE